MAVPTSSLESRPMNNLILGIAAVFDKAEEAQYLNRRFSQWNALIPGISPSLRELPKMCASEDMPAIEDPKMAHWVAVHTDCLKASLDFYFAPLEGEAIQEDFFSFLVEPFGAQPPGTAVARRTTSRAVMFAVVPDWHVDAEAVSLKEVARVHAPRRMMSLAATTGISQDEKKVITGIYEGFAKLIGAVAPEPAGAVMEIGVELIKFMLGGDDPAPSFDDMKNMMRDVVREEIINNSLEGVHATYASVKDEMRTHYVRPQAGQPMPVDVKQWVNDKIAAVSFQNHLLLEPEHRKPGFALLLIGVPLEIALYQELIQYDVPVHIDDIRTLIDKTYATEMLKIWNDLKVDRQNEITCNRYSYGVATPDHDVITCYYWRWEDRRTNEARGDRSGPWQAGGKQDTSEGGCRDDAGRHCQVVIQAMAEEFGKPDNIATEWRAARLARVPNQG